MPETAERRMIMDDMEIFRKLAQCEDKEQMQRCIEDYNNSQKPPTNADRIRAMSDEELAAYWADHYDEFCPNLPECGDMLNQNQEIPAEKCIGCALRWLQEVES